MHLSDHFEPVWVSGIVSIYYTFDCKILYV